ncbi:hypothetical protein M408DRAFT_215878 [Serendipita vermifera MAFF 305830]|uniref:DUF6535 domain-containing protein n=1 Tax=Serendipita vermifera MAFF 305830 TaxID=933852 RepID=A0A0C2X1W9_SERVB|nr:hypothetical protein M408DRAFT_215878 [Serendipita vermifera MAFF 305830]
MSQRERKAQMNRGQEDISYLQSNLPNIVMGEGIQGGQFGGMAKESTGWDVYNNEAKKVDTELVNDWRDSLNSLLLFAAIFAAVLTAFITESKKMLEQDPTEVLVDVMVFVTNNLANGTHTPYSRPEFLPNSTAIIINSLFFASLSASLIAALASVVALQWVADYDAAITRGGSSPEDRAKRRQFRYAGVVSWNMSEIIAALPLLLYCSVIIFFAGLMIWMWTLNHVVGLVVIIGASLAILFYGISTFLSVIFVSAPFRTPLSRWMYSSTQFLLILAHRLSLLLHIPFTQTWFVSQSPMATAPRRREDLEVECRSELKTRMSGFCSSQVSYPSWKTSTSYHPLSGKHLGS